MLSLQSSSSERWLVQVDQNLDEILIDHAHCEKKAAGTAMNLLFAYVENQELCREMIEIVNEVADTLDLVHDVCKVTHEHLCHMSLVYSYCDFAHGHDTRMEVVCELIGTILTDEVEMSTRSIYSPTFEVIDEGSHLQVYTEHMD